MSLEVIKPGVLTLLQDYGRYGYQGLGVTTGGPMDEHAFLWANYLLGNNINAAVLEINYGGFEARVQSDGMIAICGADLGASINQQMISPWQSYFLKRGDSICFRTPRQGARAYLAIKGGFLVSPQLKSVSTVLREGLGGLHQTGKGVQAGDVIAFSESSQEVSKGVARGFIPEYANNMVLRFIPNLSITGVMQQALYQFESQSYRLTQHMDRMGYRLSGIPIANDQNGIISQGLSCGAIQLPEDGQPIVLMKDRQTIGGYPLIGCVAYLDLSLLAQALPAALVSFRAIDGASLEQELAEYKQFFGLPC